MKSTDVLCTNEDGEKKYCYKVLIKMHGIIIMYGYVCIIKEWNEGESWLETQNTFL